MNAYEKIAKLADKDFKLITGVTRGIFDKMLEVLKRKYAEEHTQGGQPGMPVELRLTLGIGVLARISFSPTYGKRSPNR